MMTAPLRRFFVAGFAFTLSACLMEGGDNLFSGGGEDFPNTVNNLGKVAIADVSSAGQWEQLENLEIPEPPDLDGLDSLQVALPQSQSLGKVVVFAASSVPAVTGLSKSGLDSIDLSLWRLDTSSSRLTEAALLGRVYAYAFRESPGLTQADTLVAFIRDRFSLSPSALLDSIQSDPDRWLIPLEARGAETNAAGQRKSYRLLNPDRLGDFDEATFTTITPLPDGGTDRKWVRLYGADGTYLDSGVAPEAYEQLRRAANGDTLEWILIRDADWDRRLWSEDGSGVVDLYRTARGTAAPPGVNRHSLSMRAEMRRGQGLGDTLRQLRLQEERRLTGGSTVRFTFEGAGDNALLLAGDTARMTVDTVFFYRDSVIRYSASYRLQLGSAPDRIDEHALVDYSVARNWRMGPLRSTVSTFTPSTPLPLGQAFEGQMATLATYFNGDTIHTQGSAGAAGADVTMRAIRGGLEELWHVVIDSTGTVLSTELLSQPVTDSVPD